MENLSSYLEKLGLNAYETAVYTALLSLGPSSIRKIAEKAGINRGTVHLTLHSLQNNGLVSYYHKDTHQHFVAEDPKVLANLLRRRKEEFETAEQDFQKIIPELTPLFKNLNRPTVKYYDNYSGVRTVLENALDGAAKTGEYAAYSSSDISPYLYHKDAFPNFTAKRIERKIFVRTIASGPGGTVHGKDERRWLTKKEGVPVYKLIYSGRVAMISLSPRGTPHGIIIEDEGIYKTELMIFNALWKSLK